MPRPFRSGRLVLAMLLFASAATAVDFTALKPQGYVSDFAKVVDPQHRQELERYADEMKRATGVEMAFVTLASLEGEPVEDVANALYRAWGVGNKQTNEGVLLLLSIHDRRSRLEVGYGLEPIITDGDAGEILRAMRPDLKAGQYGDALVEAAREIGNRIAQGKGVSANAPPPRRHARRPRETPIPVGLILGAVFLLFALGSISGRGRRRRMSGGYGGFLPGLILGNLLGRSIGNRHGGGGFGGFDSGDSFGGFGGGDSGGGGASSSW